MATDSYEYARTLIGRDRQGDALSAEELSFLEKRYTRVSEPPASSLSHVCMDQQDQRLVDVQRIR